MPIAVGGSSLSIFLETLGYGPDLIASDYHVWVDVGINVHVDFALFGDRAVKDLSTCTAVCGVVADGEHNGRLDALADAARALAAPAIVIAQRSRVSWYPTIDISRAWITINADDLDEVERLRPVLGPQALLAAKRGSPRQLSLFPFDAAMLARRRADASNSLAARVTEVFQNVALAVVGGTERTTYQQAAQVVVRALAVVVLRDKGLVDRNASVDVSLQRWSQYFGLSGRLSAEWSDLMDTAVAELQEGINYASVDSATLSEVYQRALAAGDAAKELGIVYTPPEMAKGILDTVPLEAIPPENRLVFDPACGSGNLLVAAHDRLAGLQSPALAPGDAHSDLIHRLVGWDKDPFATEIARLSLLLHSLPLGNGWQINRADALKASAPSPAPTVIVMNPPWAWGDQRETADAFVERAIDWLAPGGFLAGIVPGTLLFHRSRPARRYLEGQCDIFEMWHLPERSFPHTRGTPSVVFARKVETKSTSPKLVKRVFPRRSRADEQAALRRLYRSHRADLTTLDGGSVTPWSNRPVKQLSEIADVVNGPQVEVDGSSEGAPVLFFGQNRGILPFADIRGEGAQVRFPGQFRRGRRLTWLPFENKIVTRAYSYPNHGWRLVAGTAPKGIVTGHSTHVVRPRDQRDFITLLAYLNSAPASVWMDQRSPGRNLSLESLRQLPVPVAATTLERLQDLGERILRSSGDDRGRLLIELDTVAMEGLEDPDLDAAVHSRLDDVPDPLGYIRVTAPRIPVEAHLDGDGFWRAGATIASDPPMVELALPGVTPLEGAWMKPPPAFPGWLAREGAGFEFAGEPNDINSLMFRLHDTEWFEWDGS